MSLFCSAHNGKVIQPSTENTEGKKLYPVCVYMTQEVSPRRIIWLQILGKTLP